MGTGGVEVLPPADVTWGWRWTLMADVVMLLETPPPPPPPGAEWAAVVAVEGGVCPP